MRVTLLTMVTSLDLAFPDLSSKDRKASHAENNGIKAPSAGSWANLFCNNSASTVSKDVVFPSETLPVEGRNCEKLGGKRLFYFMYSLILQSNNFLPTLVLCTFG